MKIWLAGCGGTQHSQGRLEAAWVLSCSLSPPALWGEEQGLRRSIRSLSFPLLAKLQ